METSKGEAKIIEILKQNNIKFKREQEFPDLRNKQKLRFDFAIYEGNKIIALIEFDGIQHFQEVKSWGGHTGLLQRQERDRRKNCWALANSIPLIRIPYYDLEYLTFYSIFNNIEYRVNTMWHNDNLKVKKKL